MIFCKRLASFALLVVVAIFFSIPLSGLAFSSDTQPDPSSNPVLAGIQKMGAKMYYLGSHSGMDGWFIVKDGQVQIVYGTPDKKSAVIGAMFGESGDSVTGIQIKALFENNKEVSALLSGAAAEQAAISNAAGDTSAAPTPAPTMGDGMPSTTLSPGEKLIQDLASSPGVTIGSAKPTLYMVMDPNCPHCQASWKALRTSVMANVLQIRMIPIGTKDTDNERAAAEFLHVADPLSAWDKYVNGDKTQLAGTPTAPQLAAVRANHTVIDTWHIQATPYMAYRAKDGKVKIVQGELDKPEKVAILLTDLGP